jgi:hypothetical protein
MKANKLKQRWRIALHEAGHLVTWRAGNIWDTACSAVVRETGGYASPPAGLIDAAYAVGTAAGAYAEKLRFPVPEVEPIARPLSAADGATAETIRAHAAADITFQRVQRGPDDARCLAPFCTKANPSDPADWKRMFDHFHKSARDLVRANAEEIRRVATMLFHAGEYTHPGTDEDNKYIRTGRIDGQTTQNEEMTG